MWSQYFSLGAGGMNLMNLGAIGTLIIVALIWGAVWKALAMWKSARKNSPVWFILLAVVNTVGILEILYIFVFSKMKTTAKAKKQIPAKKARKR